MSSPVTADLRETVRALLPFDENRFRDVINDDDFVQLTAAAAGSFAVLVRSQADSARLTNESERLAFCRAVSSAEIFEDQVSADIVQAALDGVLGSPAAIDGIRADILIEVHVMVVKELSEQLDGVEDLSLLVDDAVEMSEGIQREILALTQPDGLEPDAPDRER